MSEPICDYCKKPIDPSGGVIRVHYREGVKYYHPDCYVKAPQKW